MTRFTTHVAQLPVVLMEQQQRLLPNIKEPKAVWCNDFMVLK